jgi:predicted nucleic acid-binding protein
MAERPRRYLDSDVITRFVENAPEAATIERALREAADGRWTAVICANSMLEVSRAPNHPVDPAKFARVTAFFENDYSFRRDLDVLLAERALRLIYDYLWLRPMDAAHLAAAIDTGCEIFYTYDAELLRKFDGEHGLLVVRPGSAIEPKSESS